MLPLEHMMEHLSVWKQKKPQRNYRGQFNNQVSCD